MKLTDEQIIKSLECCLTGDYDKIINALCAKCPYCKNTDCKLILQQDALDLINRQNAEIERLHTLCKPTETSGFRIENDKVVFYTNILNGYRHECKDLTEVVKELNLLLHEAYRNDEVLSCYKGKLQTAKSEAIKDFAERFEYFVLHEDPEINELKCKDYESYMGGVKQLRFQIVKGIDNLVKEMVGD